MSRRSNHVTECDQLPARLAKNIIRTGIGQMETPSQAWFSINDTGPVDVDATDLGDITSLSESKYPTLM